MFNQNKSFINYSSKTYFEVMQDKKSKIYIAGHRGMVGAAIWRLLERTGYVNLIGMSSKELDLRNQTAVYQFLQEEKPDIIIDAAAK